MAFLFTCSYGFTQNTSTILIPSGVVETEGSFHTGGIYAMISEQGAVYTNDNRYQIMADVNCYDKAMAVYYSGFFKAQMKDEYTGKSVKCCFNVTPYKGGELASWQGAEYVDKTNEENLKNINLVWEGLSGNCVVVLRVRMDTEAKAKSYLDTMIATAKATDFTK